MSNIYSDVKEDRKLSLYAVNMTVYLKMQNNLQMWPTVNNLQTRSITVFTYVKHTFTSSFLLNGSIKCCSSIFPFSKKQIEQLNIFLLQLTSLKMQYRVYKAEQKLSKSKWYSKRARNHRVLSRPLLLLPSQLTPPVPPLDPNTGD